MKKLLALALIAVSCAAGAFTKPFMDGAFFPSQKTIYAKIGQPTWLLDVKWVRSESPIVEVRDGTCFVYMAEAFGREDTLIPMGRLLEQCVNKGATVVNERPADGARRIAVYLQPDVNHDVFAVTKVAEKFYGSFTRGRFDQISLLPNVNTSSALMVVGGLYLDPDPEHDGICTVVGFMHTLGHEVKHCFDGEFHDRAWKWLSK